MSRTRICWMIAASLACSISIASADGMHKNGLSKEAFSRNALTLNPAALAALTTHPLTQAMMTNPDLSSALGDPNARAVMTELVRCALKPTTTFVYTSSNGTQTSFTGEVGLCSDASHSGGDWSVGVPSETCQQLVTGCVLSRVNAFGQSVPISIQGDNSVPPPASSVTTEKTYRAPTTSDPAIGQTIASFLPCFPAGNCGQWVAGSVGTCAAGARVTLTETSTCNIPLQICDGIAGCVDPTQGDPPGAVPSQNRLPVTRTSCTAAFDCPPSGAFSTMIKLTGLQVKPPIQATNATYPATEDQVFGVREGAFYGNMFDTSGLTRMTCTWNGSRTCVGKVCTDCQPIPVIANTHVYSCFAAGIAHNRNENGAVYENDRVCAGASNCFNHTPDRCYYNDATDNATMGSHCTWDGQTFGTCKDPTGSDPKAYHVITTYLHASCDLIDSNVCTAIWNPAGVVGHRDADDRGDATSEGEGDGEAGISDDGGCSAGSARSGLVTLALACAAMLVARAMRRTRKEVL